MRALLFATLLAAGCVGTTTDSSGGASAVDGGGSTPVPTGLALTVHYDSSSVVTLSVSGVVLSANRKFGPYLVAADQVPPGGSIGLVFDAADAGPGMVCVSSIETDGMVHDSGCASFEITAEVVSRASLQLTDVHH